MCIRDRREPARPCVSSSLHLYGRLLNSARSLLHGLVISWVTGRRPTRQIFIPCNVDGSPIYTSVVISVVGLILQSIHVLWDVIAKNWDWVRQFSLIRGKNWSLKERPLSNRKTNARWIILTHMSVKNQPCNFGEDRSIRSEIISLTMEPLKRKRREVTLVKRRASKKNAILSRVCEDDEN